MLEVLDGGRVGGHSPRRVTVDRHQLVGEVLDWQALASEALQANGACLAVLAGLPRDAAVSQAIRATHDTHARLMQLLVDLRAAAGELDGNHT